jgi:hypothetical protein
MAFESTPGRVEIFIAWSQNNHHPVRESEMQEFGSCRMTDRKTAVSFCNSCNS